MATNQQGLVNTGDLEILAEKLNADTGEIDKIITTINDKLAALNLGAQGWAGYQTGGPQIGFAFVENKWQLVTGAGAPLLKAAPDQQIIALNFLPDLIQSLKKPAQEKLAVLEASKRIATEI